MGDGGGGWGVWVGGACPSWGCHKRSQAASQQTWPNDAPEQGKGDRRRLANTRNKSLAQLEQIFVKKEKEEEAQDSFLFFVCLSTYCWSFGNQTCIFDCVVSHQRKLAILIYQSRGQSDLKHSSVAQTKRIRHIDSRCAIHIFHQLMTKSLILEQISI